MAYLRRWAAWRGNHAANAKSAGARRLTIGAIVAIEKTFSDRAIADGVQVNSVLPGARWMTGATLRTDGGEVKSI
ncbi:MAG TPA: hypothetical protein VMF62_02185 [Acetobacteraceae bacterium]|jgi:hypothetical protein|nr:hypothetical protein [Acetobacteraceae bacterium]